MLVPVNKTPCTPAVDKALYGLLCWVPGAGCRVPGAGCWVPGAGAGCWCWVPGAGY